MRLTLTNKDNATLDLLNNRNYYILSAAEGLHGIDTNIAESETPYLDGSIIESVKALPRGIELTFILRGNIKASIDYFTRVVKSKQYVTLREIDGERDIVIKGIATIPPYSRMLQTCKLTLSIYCGQPYWEDLKYVITAINYRVGLLNFPRGNGQFFTPIGRPFGTIDLKLTKSIINKSDTTVGMMFSLIAMGKVVNPRIICNSGEQKDWYMQLNITLNENDELEINTATGSKSITINGSSDYNGEPIINSLEWSGENWLQLETGVNSFTVASENESDNINIFFNIIYKGRYE